MRLLISLFLISLWIMLIILLCFTGIGILFVISHEYGWTIILDELIDNLTS